MNHTASAERVRLGALELLASGNSIESVADVFGVSVEVIDAWRRGPAPVPVDAAAPAEAGSPEPAVAAAAYRARLPLFTETLRYTPSTALRATSLVVAIALAVVFIGLALSMPRLTGYGLSGLAGAGMMLVVGGAITLTLLRITRQALLLERRSVVVRTLSGHVEMAYAEIEGWSIRPGALRLGRNTNIAGRTLSIRSRRPGVAPTEVFLYDAYPLDPRIPARLDAMAAANAGAPPLYPLAREDAPQADADADASGRAGNRVLAIIALLGALQFVPMFLRGFDEALRPVPELGLMRHRAGLVTSASRCRRFRDRDDSMWVGLSDAPEDNSLQIPCVLDYDQLVESRRHLVAVDFDPGSTPPNHAYRITLDGRVVLGYEEAKAYWRERKSTAAWVDFLVPGGGICVLSWMAWFAWYRGRNAPDAP